VVTNLNIDPEVLLQVVISLLIVVLGYFIGGWLLVGFARFLARRWKNDFIAMAVQKIEPQLRWFALILSLQVALLRLEFLYPPARIWLDRIFVVLYMFVAFIVFWRLIDIGFSWLNIRLKTREETEVLEELIPLLKQVAYFTLILICSTILLAYFGVDVSALVATLGVAGLAISLAAKDSLADAISGALIILDHPYHVGDRIDVAGTGTFGDVIEIGLRSTRILLPENKLVVIPNGVIARSQVVNYTYPDTIVRQTYEFGVSAEAEVENVKRIIAEAVRHADGVLPDRPVDVRFARIGNPGLIFQVDWWIDIRAQAQVTGPSVQEVINHSLVANDIETPYSAHEVRLNLGGNQNALLSNALQNA
jgi:small-conductance mechanosensitive channel